MEDTNGLLTVTAERLDAWIMDVLQPSTEFSDQVKWTTNQICEFLKKDCFLKETNIHVNKTVKVSTGRLRDQPAPLLPPFPLSCCSSSCPASVSPGSPRNGGRRFPR